MNEIARQAQLALPPAMPPDLPPRNRNLRAGPFGVLDIGSTKIACLIGRTDSDGTLRALGSGLTRSRGVRGASHQLVTAPIAPSNIKFKWSVGRTVAISLNK